MIISNLFEGLFIISNIHKLYVTQRKRLPVIEIKFEGINMYIIKKMEFFVDQLVWTKTVFHTDGLNYIYL